MLLFKPFRYLVLLIFAYCTPAPKVAGQFSDQAFDEMAKKMSTGNVPDISVEHLSGNMEGYVLLDTREKKEFEISHLPNAIWVGYDDFNLERVKAISKNQKIVTYCSVGYRSERIGEKLLEAGFSDVHNLNGSLFKWVNEGLPVVDNTGKSTTKVHGYDKKWAKWLKKGKIIY